MTTNDLFQEIETLSPVQMESVYSFVYLLKHPDYIVASLNEEENIEPFANEKEALDFVNYYAGRMLHETR
ncbi:MAG: hypothetical protein LBH20_05380 [Treponema sp.]|jgi:hypothetical protein|nr:hypothetical protein [Treponema sp.]